MIFMNFYLKMFIRCPLTYSDGCETSARSDGDSHTDGCETTGQQAKHLTYNAADVVPLSLLLPQISGINFDK
jgi:hypothetical protein